MLIELERIERLTKRIINTGDANAIHNLACHYYRGRHGLSKDVNKALKLWHGAGMLGHSASYYNIACAYLEGVGVDQSNVKAIYYYELAIGNDGGHADYEICMAEKKRRMPRPNSQSQPQLLWL